jgi:hypothetical protein
MDRQAAGLDDAVMPHLYHHRHATGGRFDGGLGDEHPLGGRKQGAFPGAAANVESGGTLAMTASITGLMRGRLMVPSARKGVKVAATKPRKGRDSEGSFLGAMPR